MTEIPDEVAQAVNDAVNTALAQESSANPLVAQSFLGLPTPKLNLGGAKDKVVQGLNLTTEALDILAKYNWLIPDQYEVPLNTLNSALKKVKGWIS